MSTQIISRTRIGNYAVVAIIMCLLALIVAVVLIALQKEALAIQQAQISFCAKSFPTDRQGVTILQYGDSVAICGQAGSALRETKAQVLAVWETQKGDFVDMAPFEWSGNEPESEGMIAFSAVPSSGRVFAPGDYTISIVVGHDSTKVMNFRVEPGE